MTKYNVELKLFFCKVYTEFYGDFVYTFRKIIGRYDFLTISERQLFVIKIVVITQMFCDRRHAWLLI